MAAAGLLGTGPAAAAAPTAGAWSVEAVHAAGGARGGTGPDRRLLRAVDGTTFVHRSDGDADRVEAHAPDGSVVGTWHLVGTTLGTDGSARMVATVDDHGDAAVYTLTQGAGAVTLDLPSGAAHTVRAVVRGGVVHLDRTT